MPIRPEPIATPRPPPRPEALPGFERISRTWSQQDGCYLARILPGEVYVSEHAEVITTVLGSCISACIRDPYVAIGGMNHFMLPSTDTTDPHQATRYGSYAMEKLINTIMKHGGQRRNLEVKLFGGGKMIPTMGDIGGRNISFVRDYLRGEGFSIVAEDLGEIYPRKVNYYPKTGKALVKRLRPLHKRALGEQDQALLRSLAQQPVESDIELFN